jgi:dihydropteroate synthase
VDIDGLKVGADFPPRIMSVINLSPESFYRDSIVDNREQLVKVINSMEQENGKACCRPWRAYCTDG